MKKTYLLFIVLNAIVITIHAQTPAKAYLDINNIKAAFYSSGDLFWDLVSKPEFEVPKGSGKNSMFASSLWIGGFDAGGQLKIAANTYRQLGVDFWAGPLNSTGTTDSTTIYNYNKIWKINQCDIDSYITWLNNGQSGSNPVNSTVMNVINTWPAFNPQGAPLAPFVDANSNGIYDPANGDYPKIKGDQALFFVFNDNGGLHKQTGGKAIGLEMQVMAYAYNCSKDSALYNTLFTNYKIINKSSFRLDSAFVGMLSDMDIGYSFDDYIACDVTRGAYYQYNGTAIDQIYGANPPAQAVVFLDGPFANPDGIDNPANTTPNGTKYGDGIVDNERLGMSNFVYYNNDLTPMGYPSLPTHYYNYLTSTWKDGLHITYGSNGRLGTTPCNYMFPGTSDPLGYGTNMVPQPVWDETTSGNTPADRRGLGSTGPFTFQPGSVEEVDFAYVYGRATSGDSVRTKFNKGIKGCGCNNITIGIKKLSDDHLFTFYPNPATNSITIDYKSLAKNYNVKIYDVTGRLVKNSDHLSLATTIINIDDLEKGIYLLNVYDGTTSSVKRFVKQ